MDFGLILNLEGYVLSPIWLQYKEQHIVHFEAGLVHAYFLVSIKVYYFKTHVTITY